MLSIQIHSFRPQNNSQKNKKIISPSCGPYNILYIFFHKQEELYKFMNYNEKKGQLYLWIGILVSVVAAFSALYIIYLINRSEIVSLENQSEIDIYQIKLEQHLGIGGSNYNERPMYTSDLFDSDMRSITKDIENKRFDRVSETAGSILSKYQFNDDKLSTISALEMAYIFDPEYSSTLNERIYMVSKIKDPIIYVRFFMLLTIEEQRYLIQQSNVNILPCFQYDSIKKEPVNAYEHGFSDITTNESQLYKLTLSYSGRQYYVYISVGSCCNIIYVNDESKSLKSTY